MLGNRWICLFDDSNSDRGTFSAFSHAKCSPIVIDLWGAFYYNNSIKCSPTEAILCQYNIMKYKSY
jgi:hypothetical protein